MAVHDTIGDFLTIIRNASGAQKETCEVQFSKLRLGIATVLKDAGYITNVEKFETERGLPAIRITLKYVDSTPAITGLKRQSKPGCRIYKNCGDIPKVLGGLGVAILTTSRGVMEDREARKLSLGGELLCTVW